MGQCIVHHNGVFAIWSTVVDSIVSDPMTEDEMIAYLRSNTTIEQEQIRPIAARIADAKRKGTSMQGDESFADTVRFNRMGPREGRLPISDVISGWMAFPEDKA